MHPDSPTPSPSTGEWFVSTHWSVVAAAGADTTQARAALENLCRTYWYPLYAFTRRLGHLPEDAEDAVQSFFTECIEKNYLAAADESKGRFRSFLLVMLKRFLAKQWHKSTAKKRGGGAALVELDALSAEQRYAVEPVQRLGPEELYERRWALSLLETVLRRLEEEQREGGRYKIFKQLKETLVSSARGTPYAALGEKLGMSEAAVKVAVHRLRERYRALLDIEIANTVASREEIDEERRYLLSVLAR